VRAGGGRRRILSIKRKALFVYHDFLTRSRGALITSSILLIEHICLWDLRDRLPLVARYTLGTLAIGAGVSYAAYARRDWRAAADFWTCAAIGGGLVALAHLIREMQEQPADRLLGGSRHGIR